MATDVPVQILAAFNQLSVLRYVVQPLGVSVTTPVKWAASL